MKFDSARAPAAAIGLAAALFIVIAAISGGSVWQGYYDAVERGEQRARTAAQTVAAHFQWFIEASRQALQRIDDTVEFRPELLSASELGDIDDAIGGLPASADVRIFNADGRELFNTDPVAGELEISDRDYFNELRNGKELVISSLLIDRITKKQSFVVGRRLIRAGKFAGVATIVVPSDLILTFWASLGLGPVSATSIVRDDGWVVTRYPKPENAINLYQEDLFTKYLAKSPSGSYQAISAADGVTRIVGYNRVPNAPLIAVAAISRDTALAEFRVRMRRLAYGLVPVLIGLTGFAWWVSLLLLADGRQRQSLEYALNQNRLLLREIHHRVKNNLQTVASLVRLQALPAEAKRDLANRIAAMAAVHEQIYKSDHFGDVDLETYLPSIVEGVRSGFNKPVEVSFEMDKISISPDRATVAGLLITEVVTNSLKHGFPGKRTGEIKVALSHQPEDRIRLEISDNGVGFQPEELSEGLGHKLVKSFAMQLEGTYTIIGEGGLKFEIEFPQESARADQAEQA